MREGPMLRFESSSFSAERYEDETTNPDMYAKAFAAWLAVKLNERGIKTIGVFSEDFGWCVGVPTKPREIYVACASDNGRGKSFEVFYFSIGGLLSLIFEKGKAFENLKKLHHDVKDILRSNHNIQSLREEP
jgi:hypothetical protein